MPVSVRHFPPGPGKWNKIEPRMFSYITKNWRGKPTGIEVPDEVMRGLNMKKPEFHGEWNHRIPARPR
jgi:hypothetical protein